MICAALQPSCSSDEPWAGGPPLLAYCLGGEVRAEEVRGLRYAEPNWRYPGMLFCLKYLANFGMQGR
jgi:hypothetical protein